MDIKNDRIVSKETLKKYFGYENFLNTQEYICKKVFKGTNDIYLNLQPGNGKSLCFQLPTVLKSHKLSVVFVPRDILAKDHILFLRQRGIDVDYICTRSCKKRLKTMISSYKCKKIKKPQFLYVLVQKQTVELIKDWMVEFNSQNALSYIVFDEAHCVSSLSHDYIPAYQEAAELVRKTCPNVCKIALTATATSEVRRDIISKLRFKNVTKFHSLPDCRTSTYYDVYFADEMYKPLDHLTEFIKKAVNESSHSLSQVTQKCGIIFCRKRQVTNDIVTYLTSKNILAAAYHGGLSLKDRDSIFGKWANGKIRAIVATNTFGIGLRNPNTRFVVHWNLPLSFQQMYQESARVNPDGGKNYCRMYYSYNEENSITTYLKFLSKQSGESIELMTQRLKFFEEVVNYCHEVKCRHVSHWTYFGQTVGACGKFCDACSEPKKLRRRVNASLKYRELKKKGNPDKLAYEELKDLGVSVKIEVDCTANKAENVTILTRSVRCRSLKRLIYELMENYKKSRHQGVEKHVIEIACTLEHSLYNGAPDQPSKYNHHVALAISNIRRATKSGLDCIYFVTQEEYVDPKPNVIVVPKPVINDEIIIID